MFGGRTCVRREARWIRTPPLPTGGLKELEVLGLCGTQVTNAGCATLVAALDSGALPALEEIYLDGTSASDAAIAAVRVKIACNNF